MNETLLIIGGVALWVAIGIYNFGVNCAFWQKRFPLINRNNDDIGMAWFSAFLGPFGLLPSMLVCGGGWQYGFLFRKITNEERIQYLRKEHAELTAGQEISIDPDGSPRFPWSK